MKTRLLVVDDDPAVRRVIKRMLEGAEREILEAANGAEALRLVSERHPDLVLLDIHMPRMGGIAALSAIARAHPEVAVIMVSGDDDLALARSAMEQGACDYLTKPVDARSLHMSVSAYL